MGTNAPPVDTVLPQHTSVLDVFAPRSSQIDLIKVIQENRFNDVREVPQRLHIFFDEETDIFVVLKTSLNESQLRETLPAAHLDVAGHATDAVPQGTGKAATASGKYDLTSNKLSGKDLRDMFVCDGHTFVVWKTQLQVTRPRVRLQRPAIYFTANLTYNQSVAKREHAAKYLERFEHLSPNVLEPLRQDTMFFENDLSLPETRLIKVTPMSASPRESVRPLRGASNRAYPVIPAFLTRTRCLTISERIFLSVHIEATPLVARSIEVQKLRPHLDGATIQDLATHPFPQIIESGDEYVRLFQVLPLEKLKSNCDIQIAMTATVFSRDGSDVVVRSTGQAHVVPFQSRSTLTRRWARPLSATLTQSRVPVQKLPPTDDKEEWSQIVGKQVPGVDFTFSCSTIARCGNDVDIIVQCINRSNRVRRFLLVPFIPKQSKSNHHTSSSIASIISDASGLRGEQVSNTSQKPTALDLSPEVKIGPLSQGASHETTLKYRAMKAGLLGYGMVRIVDLDTRQTVDIKELPNIIATNT